MTYKAVPIPYRTTKIPQRFWGMSLDSYKIPPGSEDARDIVGDYIANIGSYLSDGVGLTFSGPPGEGKTMLMSIIGMAAVDAGYTVYYMPMARYIRNQLNLIAWSGVDALEDDFVDTTRLQLRVRNKVQFLLLDDVGKEHHTNTGFAQDEFDFLVRLRYDKALPTIITTNVPVDTWNGKYSAAMQSFVNEAFPEVIIDTKDYRGRR